MGNCVSSPSPAQNDIPWHNPDGSSTKLDGSWLSFEPATAQASAASGPGAASATATPPLPWGVPTYQQPSYIDADAACDYPPRGHVPATAPVTCMPTTSQPPVQGYGAGPFALHTPQEPVAYQVPPCTPAPSLEPTRTPNATHDPWQTVPEPSTSYPTSPYPAHTPPTASTATATATFSGAKQCGHQWCALESLPRCCHCSDARQVAPTGAARARHYCPGCKQHEAVEQLKRQEMEGLQRPHGATNRPQSYRQQREELLGSGAGRRAGDRGGNAKSSHAGSSSVPESFDANPDAGAKPWARVHPKVVFGSGVVISGCMTVNSDGSVHITSRRTSTGAANASAPGSTSTSSGSGGGKGRKQRGMKTSLESISETDSSDDGGAVQEERAMWRRRSMPTQGELGNLAGMGGQQCTQPSAPAMPSSCMMLT